MKRMTIALLLGLMIGCGRLDSQQQKGAALATFAGGCFWCMEPPFEKLPGVYSVKSGYTGGKEANPDYRQVSSGKSTHREAVQIEYDPARIGYEELLEVFWRQIDPTDAGGQFVDRGKHYTTAIYFHSENQKKAADSSLRALARSGRFQKPVVTEILPAGVFYPAEAYHQDYYKKNPVDYYRYRNGSGRDAFIQKHWGKEKTGWKEFKRPPDRELRSKLSEMQYRVTREDGTEPPFRNEFWNSKARGIYVDIVSGEPLFSSRDKYDSGTGWPSFTRPLDKRWIQEAADESHGMKRVEVRSKLGDSHLGHVFDDGPAPQGLRYCINSAALRFIPEDRMAREGYGEFLSAL